MCHGKAALALDPCFTCEEGDCSMAELAGEAMANGETQPDAGLWFTMWWLLPLRSMLVGSCSFGSDP